MTSQVAKDAQWVSEHSTLVEIDQSSLESFTSLLFSKIKSGSYRSVDWSLDNPLHPKSGDENIIDWIFLLDSLNFSFWPNSGQHYSINKEVGYWALCAAINRALRNNIPITKPEYYKNITEKEAKDIFRTDQENIQVPLLKQRMDIMKHNGNVLCERFGGSFNNVLKQAQGNAQRLLTLVCEHFPSFRDEASFNGHPIKILKRAQILVADVWGCFHGKNEGHFEDIDSLTMFADYRIPQALHFFGVLKYSKRLLTMLQDPDKNILENGSKEEVEIRCNSIHAVELIRARLLQECSLLKDENIEIPNSIEIDFYVWGFRRDHSEEIDLKSPYHRVRCIYY